MWSYSMVLVHMREYLDVLLGFSLPMVVTLSSVLYVDHRVLCVLTLVTLSRFEYNLVFTVHCSTLGNELNTIPLKQIRNTTTSNLYVRITFLIYFKFVQL